MNLATIKKYSLIYLVSSILFHISVKFSIIFLKETNADILEGIYPNMEALIMAAPAKRVSYMDNYVEVFVFKKHNPKN